MTGLTLLARVGRRRKTDPLDAQHLAEDLAAHPFGRKGLLCQNKPAGNGR